MWRLNCCQCERTWTGYPRESGFDLSFRCMYFDIIYKENLWSEISSLALRLSVKPVSTLILWTCVPKHRLLVSGKHCPPSNSGYLLLFRLYFVLHILFCQRCMCTKQMNGSTKRRERAEMRSCRILCCQCLLLMSLQTNVTAGCKIYGYVWIAMYIRCFRVLKLDDEIFC